MSQGFITIDTKLTHRYVLDNHTSAFASAETAEYPRLSSLEAAGEASRTCACESLPSSLQRAFWVTECSRRSEHILVFCSRPCFS